MDRNKILHVEICQKADSTLVREDAIEIVDKFLESSGENIELNEIINTDRYPDTQLNEHIESVLCSCKDLEKSHLKAGVDTIFHLYRLTEEDAATESMQNDNEELAMASHWILPSRHFHYMWENLHYDNDVKENLLSFVETTLTFSDRKVDPNIISWNKVILLHGPPGSGKTSLCKALAQKLAIRLENRFTHGELIEINSHSLFSKWFSESGKLVMKLFNEMRALLENPEALVCILIDEIESLAHVRKVCTSGVEPTDSIRVVNALLTQLDQIKRYPNALILATSNMTEAIDLAFIDRADIKQYIGHPSQQAIYKIYSSCVKELMKTGLVEFKEIYELKYLRMHGYEENTETQYSVKLLELSRESEGFSGRNLRKIPFLAYAFFPQHKNEPYPLHRFLRSMHLTIEKQKEEAFEKQY